MKRSPFAALCVIAAFAVAGYANPKKDAPIEIKSKVVDDLSSEYFGYFDLDVINNTDEWMVLRNVEITFATPAQTRHVKAITGAAFTRWQGVMQKRIAKSELSKNATLAVIGAVGYGLAMASGNSTVQNIGATAALGATGTYAASEYAQKRDSVHQTKRFPENHLLADSIVVLPGLSEGRWLLLNSAYHDSTKLVSEFIVSYTTQSGERLSNTIKVGRTPWQKKLWWTPNAHHMSPSGIYR